MAQPPKLDMVSELSPILKTSYPRRKLDQFGIKFAKGHRTATVLSGHRPIHRTPKRPARST